MSKLKIRLVISIFFLISVFLGYSLAKIQIVEHKYYKAMAQGQQAFNYLRGERGSVFFSGGEILASNLNLSNILINPLQIEDKDHFLKEVSSFLEIEEDELLEKINRNSRAFKIEENVKDGRVEEVINLGISGIYPLEERKRFYPQENMASHLIGFLGGEDIGQYGVEGYYEDKLKGDEILGRRISFFEAEASKGSNIVLTIDYNIQFMAERLLQEAEETLNIEGGSIIVANPRTGEIMAMANLPNYNPNNYSREEMSLYKNPSIQKLFEPGSISKAITLAGAINEGSITPDTEYLDTGEVRIGGHTLRNYGRRSYGRVTMTEVLEKSINTGAVLAADKMGKDAFVEYLERFGFLSLTGIDLAGEVYSENLEFKRGYDVNYATASYGQGINITPIQLLASFFPITNNGKSLTPYLLKEENIEREVREVISPETALKVTSMLVDVIEKGFGRQARIPGYYIAGKTGTSQIPWPVLGVNKRGYSDKTWQSFLGFAPAFNPRFLILVKLDNPSARTAEYSAMPIFRELAKYIIDYLQIPPDYET